ncbi:GAF domain-containing SpoIIE family protein phosphatase [Streptomyces sp. NPDC005438]|uniref:PP2C family protein-serine/threonine phosphatase n=1 Tax=Streptomyces sp. NPDC005438 TaxID=3156880 RepID=UPI0033B71FB7
MGPLSDGTAEGSSLLSPGIGDAWQQAPCPVLVADGTGTLTRLNSMARRLFPDAAPGRRLEGFAPPWLTDAHRELVEAPGTATAARGPLGERLYEAHPTPGEQGEFVWWLLDDTERQLADRSLGDERDRIAFLAEVSDELLSSLNVNRSMETIARHAVQHLADAAVVVAGDPAAHLVLTRCAPDGEVSRVRRRARAATMPGLAEALRGFPPVASRWIDPASVPEWVLPPGFEGPLGSVVVTPLPGHGVPAGALVLLRRTDHTAFTQGEELFAQLFAARAGIALSAARMYTEQAAITQTLMRELLPPRLHRVHGIEFAGGYRASGVSERVGGDFYDVHPGADENEESLVVLGDVCGKGLEAAVLTGKIRNTLHALLPMARDHDRVLNLLNGALLTTRHTRFATLVLASAVRRGPDVRLRLTSAGHLPPLVVRRDGSVETVPTSGNLVGVMPSVDATTVETVVAPGEVCLLYTDGITEARGGPFGGELFGERRLRDALAECAGLPGEAVVERVQMLASEWVGDARKDDMALVAVGAPAFDGPFVPPWGEG